MRFAHRSLVVLRPWPPFWWETTELVALRCAKHRRTREASRPGREAARATLVRVSGGASASRAELGQGAGPQWACAVAFRGEALNWVGSPAAAPACPCRAPDPQASGSTCRPPPCAGTLQITCSAHAAFPDIRDSKCARLPPVCFRAHCTRLSAGSLSLCYCHRYTSAGLARWRPPGVCVPEPGRVRAPSRAQRADCWTTQLETAGRQDLMEPRGPVP